MKRPRPTAAGTPAAASPAGTPTPSVAPIPPKQFGSLYAMPTFDVGRDPSIEKYKERLSEILKEVSEANTLAADPDYTKKNIGSFTLLPTYNKEGWLGGHKLEEIAEALEARKKELLGNNYEYGKHETTYNEAVSQLADVRRDLTEAKEVLERERPTLKDSEVQERLDNIERLENNEIALKGAIATASEAMRKERGFIPTMSAALQTELAENINSPTINITRGRLEEANAELALIKNGLDLLPKLSAALSDSKQDATFAAKGKPVKDIADGSVLRNTLELAATQKTRAFIGKEIKSPGTRIEYLKGEVRRMGAQIHRMREELVNSRSAVTPETREQIQTLIEALLELNQNAEKEGLPSLPPEVKYDINTLFIFLDDDRIKEINLKQIHGPQIHMDDDGTVLRPSSPSARLIQSDDPLSVKHIVMEGTHPLADLKRAQRTYGNNLAVYQAWKQNILDTGKIDEYRAKAGTKNLWESKEREEEQIATSKERFELYLKLLELDDFTPPHLTDNFKQQLYRLVQLLSGINDKHNDISWEVSHYSHEDELEQIAKLKQALADAEEAKKKEELGKFYIPKTEAPEAAPNKRPVADVLEKLTNEKEWMADMPELSQSALLDEEKKIKKNIEGEVSTSIDLNARKITEAIQQEDYTRLVDILAGLKIDKNEIGVRFTPDIELLEKKWFEFHLLFEDLDDKALTNLPEHKARLVRSFKAEEAAVTKIFSDMRKYIDGSIARYAALEKQVIEAKATIEKEAFKDLPVTALRAIRTKSLAINEENLIAEGVAQDKAAETVATLRKFGKIQ